ncbi:hypothetical protein HNR12_001485 [Streptomonospora nanhaiensis]|uniref:TauD/TfdA-like domain-containing protein n=1 Tax=Streptomonospora nanhaiensis TaxID=1323731 RepID=A0A853BI87_9ACTN|nr:hypothetical protein [Streptomonospora nanhaiensis]
MAAALGDLYGWANQQGGRLVHNILPIPGQERAQVGASSTTTLTRHTEDAFHPLRPHILLLAALRNPDGVGSLVSSVRRVGLTDAQRAQLERPRVVITPDDSYRPPEDAGSWTAVAAPGIATVWAAPDGPCLRFDPAYSRLPDDPGFADAYAALEKGLEIHEEEVPLQAGDIILIDNDVAVHGRRPFRPRYDGTDRWLKRAIVRLDRPRPEAEARESGFGQRATGPRAPR